MALQVFLQVAQLGERLGTDVTGEGAFSGMCPHMSLQQRGVRELHRAHAAAERTVPSVHPHVLLQVRLLRKLTTAHLARHL